MEIGIILFGDMPPGAGVEGFHAHKRLRELTEQIRLADDVGLDIVGLGEHHRPEYAVSSPEIVLAAAAGVTKRIKLTSAVTVLSHGQPDDAPVGGVTRSLQELSLLESINQTRHSAGRHLKIPREFAACPTSCIVNDLERKPLGEVQLGVREACLGERDHLAVDLTDQSARRNRR